MWHNYVVCNISTQCNTESVRMFISFIWLILQTWSLANILCIVLWKVVTFCTILLVSFFPVKDILQHFKTYYIYFIWNSPQCSWSVWYGYSWNPTFNSSTFVMKPNKERHNCFSLRKNCAIFQKLAIFLANLTQNSLTIEVLRDKYPILW